MTQKQQRFVEEYLIDFNGAAAARRAGYSKRRAKETAARLVTDGNVLKAIVKGRFKVAEDAEITAADVVRGLLGETTRETLNREPSSARIRAWELLGQASGHV